VRGKKAYGNGKHNLGMDITLFVRKNLYARESIEKGEERGKTTLT